MTKKKAVKKTSETIAVSKVDTSKKSITGDHNTLAQVADMCAGFQTESEMFAVKKASIADCFMSAAQIYITDKPDGEPMPKDHAFLMACKAQEDFSKSTEAGLNQWDKIPANWSQMKSNIKAAYNKGIDINDFEYESKMREELNNIRKEEKGEKVDQVEDSLSDVTESASPELAQRLFAINNLCKDMTPAQTDDVIRILDEAIQSIAIMKELVAETQKEAAA